MKFTFVLASFFAGSAIAGINSPTAVYGVDNRVEVINSDPAHYLLSNSTAAMIAKGRLAPSTTSSGLVYLLQNKGTLEEDLQKTYGSKVCANTKFIKQRPSAVCTGTLIAPDLLITAGHCVETAELCNYYAWVFNYKTNTNGVVPTKFDANDVYECKKIVSYSNDSINDYALVQLKTKVVGHEPLQYRTSDKIGDDEKVLVIGTPNGLPLKVATDGKIFNNQINDIFITTLDTFQGNSGSPVFNETTNIIEGILTGGEKDYEVVSTRNGSCLTEKKCTELTCTGEKVFRVSSIPEIYALDRLVEYAEAGYITGLTNMLAMGSWIDFPNRYGTTVLMSAALYGQNETVKFLLESNADPLIKDGSNYTPIHYLAPRLNGDSIPSLTMLMKAGVSIDSLDINGQPAIVIAAKAGNLQGVKVLFFAGAKIKDFKIVILDSFYELRDQAALDELVDLGFAD